MALSSSLRVSLEGSTISSLRVAKMSFPFMCLSFL